MKVVVLIKIMALIVLSIHYGIVLSDVSYKENKNCYIINECKSLRSLTFRLTQSQDHDAIKEEIKRYLQVISNKADGQYESLREKPLLLQSDSLNTISVANENDQQAITKIFSLIQEKNYVAAKQILQEISNPEVHDLFEQIIERGMK